MHARVLPLELRSASRARGVLSLGTMGFEAGRRTTRWAVLGLVAVACFMAQGCGGPAGAVDADVVSADATGDVPDIDGSDAAVDVAPPPMVTTRSGPVRGATSRGVHRFFGIPYAAPPVGALRFRAPTPPPSWTEPRDASQPRAMCPQPASSLLPGRGTQQEDCLDVNVFSPDVSPTARLPVMVWVHGGAFVIGAGNSEIYDGTVLASRRVVVVTMNYRLGLAGFLAHPALSAEHPTGSSGMWGVMDQQAALGWVRDNIAAFGGDPSRVTLFGESAGAMSVCANYFSRAARGLFTSAISQSGVCVAAGPALRHFPSAAAARLRGVALATALGCPGETPATAACLRALPADALARALRVEVAGSVDSPYGLLPIGPNVDGTVLTDDPDALAERGDSAGVPYIIGTNRDEGTLFTDDRLLTTAAAADTLIRSWFAAPIASALLAHYTATRFGTPLAAIDALIRDVGFRCPTLRVARALTAARVDVRSYHLTQTNPVSDALQSGAAHGIDLLYTFGNYVAPFARPSAAERSVQDALQGYWTRFAATADPNGPGAIAWPTFGAAATHLVFADPLTTGTALGNDDCTVLAAIPAM